MSGGLRPLPGHHAGLGLSSRARAVPTLQPARGGPLHLRHLRLRLPALRCDLQGGVQGALPWQRHGGTVPGEQHGGGPATGVDAAHVRL